MRAPFQDNATEGRLLSISPHERTNNVPILLDKKYIEDTRQLRNEIARFVLQHWQEVDGEKLMNFGGLGLEPRLQQLAMPISMIFQLWEEGKKLFMDYMLKRQQDLKRERAMSWEGMIFNYVLDLAVGNEEVDEKYSGYYIPAVSYTHLTLPTKDLIDREKAKAFYEDETPIIQAITPAMVAKAFNTTAKAAAKALRGIGFEVQNKKITFYEGNKHKSKTVNAFYVEDEKRWNEIMQRYFFYDSVTQVTQVTQQNTPHLNIFLERENNIPLVFSCHTPVLVCVTSVTSMTGRKKPPSPASDACDADKPQTLIAREKEDSILQNSTDEEQKPIEGDNIKSISPLQEGACERCNKHGFLTHKWMDGEEEHLICYQCAEEIAEDSK